MLQKIKTILKTICAFIIVWSIFMLIPLTLLATAYIFAWISIHGLIFYITIPVVSLTLIPIVVKLQQKLEKRKTQAV